MLVGDERLPADLSGYGGIFHAAECVLACGDGFGYPDGKGAAKLVIDQKTLPLPWSSSVALTVSDIRFLFEQYGDVAYSGEPVTQLQHALQTGALAEEAGADDELVAAAFLHDLGHLLNQQGETPTERAVDDLHQYFALPFLRTVLPDAVLEPIRLHVDAKRCLCAIDDAYIRQLSADSVRSLALQGGVFSRDEADAFLLQAYAQDALRLRKWDDQAKQRDRATRNLSHYLGVVERVMSKGSIVRLSAM